MGVSPMPFNAWAGRPCYGAFTSAFSRFDIPPRRVAAGGVAGAAGIGRAHVASIATILAAAVSDRPGGFGALLDLHGAFSRTGGIRLYIRRSTPCADGRAGQ